ncbi:MAG: endolytic transglycosylase MltG [Candidatus Shapirobacteria bacterium]|nr:endolytic transglycosylase MltG [Candidatus Shapirobacteria bacterium]
MKKFKIFLILLLILIILLGGIFFWWQWTNSAISKKSSIVSQTFIVKKGESLSSVAQHLEETGLIRNALFFRLLISFEGLENKIQAGSFSLKPSLSSKEIVTVLTHGTADIWLTFPEGWRKEEFAQRLTANLNNFDQKQFLQLVTNHEGELFPDTYLFPMEASPSAVLNLFLNNLQRKFSADFEQILAKSGLTKKQALILASLVERETKHEESRAIVAGILIKRLKADWPLQIDATLQYALANSKVSTSKSQLDNWWPVATAADKKINSPYNTYQNKGLPPTPICNPGLSSIKAVVYPQATDYWFYLSDSEGQMHYAKTAEEHNENIANYLR